MSIFSVGTGALNAAQVGILTASHNISNASTPGYNRQEIVQGTNFANLTGSGYIGAGTNVQTVKRIYDQFLSRQILSAEAGSSEMDAYLSQVSQIDNLFADPAAGLSPAMVDFFKGVQEVAANPASIPGRQSMLSASQSLIARFQGLDQRMSEMRDGINSQVRGQVQSINTFASQIAEMNQRIILAEAGSRTQVPNDLYDQRDQMVREMNKFVRVTTVTQSDGAFNVFIGKGQPLVIGSQAYSLAAVADPADPEKFIIAMNGVGGNLLTLPESQITGGTLGGLLAFRRGSLDGAQNALGRIAITLAQNFNDQHNLGMDLTGSIGTDFFSFSDPVVRKSSLNAGTGAPTATIDTATLSQLSNSDYRLNTPDGTQFQVTRLSDGAIVVPMMNIADWPLVAPPGDGVEGFKIDFTAWTSPQANDSFLIQPTRAGAKNIGVAVTDPRAIAAAAPIRSAGNLANTGTASISAGVVNAPPPTNVDLTQPVTITFDTPPTTFSVTGGGVLLPPSGTYTSGADITYNGWTVQIKGNPAAGDIFTIGPNLNGVADNRNAQLLGALQTTSTMLEANGVPTASYQSAYSQIVSEVGSKTREVKTIGAAQQGLAEHAITSMQQISGVNLDEEAANLLRYQQAYQASAKILEIATRVFDEVLALGR
jgi:flagellar hook-associated protein 1 FlgK